MDPRAIRVHFSVRSYEGGQRTGICRLLGRSCRCYFGGVTMETRSFLYGGVSSGDACGGGGGGDGGGDSVLLTNKRVHRSFSLNPVDSFFLNRSSSFQSSVLG